MVFCALLSIFKYIQNVSDTKRIPDVIIHSEPYMHLSFHLSAVKIDSKM